MSLANVNEILKWLTVSCWVVLAMSIGSLAISAKAYIKSIKRTRSVAALCAECDAPICCHVVNKWAESEAHKAEIDHFRSHK